MIDLLPEVPERVYSVGRLDEDSMGLMILTNDGELANRLAHPRYGVEKTYRALVAGTPSREIVGKLIEGIWLSDGKARAKRARVVGTQGEATILELVLAEGKKREIRRMLAKLGHKVMSLTRIAIGPVVLKGLPPGEHRPLSRAEIDLLRKVAAGIAGPPPRFLDQGGLGSRRPSRGPRRSEGRPETAEGQAPRETAERPAPVAVAGSRGRIARVAIARHRPVGLVRTRPGQAGFRGNPVGQADAQASRCQARPCRMARREAGGPSAASGPRSVRPAVPCLAGNPLPTAQRSPPSASAACAEGGGRKGAGLGGQAGAADHRPGSEDRGRSRPCRSRVGPRGSDRRIKRRPPRRASGVKRSNEGEDER